MIYKINKINSKILSKINCLKLIKPLVTCVISSYNHDKYIFKCIKSIIDQDYQNIELIIIDDGSNDKSTIEITNY